MQKIFQSTFKSNPENLSLLKQKIQTAKDSASKAGPNALLFVRICDQLRVKIDNFEKLSKPKKKDFGKFSGLIAAALFLPLFLIMSWANTAFEINAESASIIYTSLVLSLIGGFGYGALKYFLHIFSKFVKDKYQIHIYIIQVKQLLYNLIFEVTLLKKFFSFHTFTHQIFLFDNFF